MTQAEFERQRNAAVESMRRMNARRAASTSPASKSKPASNSHCESNIPKPKDEIPKKPSTFGFEIPFLNSISSDKDTALILGLLLILMGEDCDKKLLFALVYILF